MIQKYKKTINGVEFYIEKFPKKYRVSFLKGFFDSDLSTPLKEIEKRCFEIANQYKIELENQEKEREFFTKAGWDDKIKVNNITL